MDVSSVKPGNIIKYQVDNPASWSPPEEKLFEVKAVDNNQIFGQQLTNITQIMNNDTMVDQNIKLDVIA